MEAGSQETSRSSNRFAADVRARLRDFASYDHSALFFVTNWQVIDVGYVASRHSRAGLVRGRPCPNGGVANRTTGTI
jgi:hypothetical protein